MSQEGNFDICLSYLTYFPTYTDTGYFGLNVFVNHLNYPTLKG